MKQTFENNKKKTCLRHLVVHQIVCKRRRILPFFELLDEPNGTCYVYTYDDKYYVTIRSQWPRRIRRGSAGDRLLGLRV